MEPVQLLRVRAGGRLFGIDVAAVRAIDRPNRWARLPWAPTYVRGVAEVAGQVVPVVDLARRLGLRAGPPLASEGVILIESAEPVALAVEAIEDVEPLDPERARDLGAAGRRAGARALTPDGLILLEGEPLVDGRPLEPLDAILGEAGAAAREEGGA